MKESPLHVINIDGAARGNPGPAAFAYVISAEGSPVVEEAGRLGHATNNVAEYSALVRALERAAELGAHRLAVRSDSELLVKQMNGEYRVKHPQLVPLFEQASRLRGRFESVSIDHVRREQNRRADELCNEVLDGKPSASTGGKRHSAKAVTARVSAVREEGLLCLRSAAQAWKQGDANAPTAEQVWDQLWSIFEDSGVLKPVRS